MERGRGGREGGYREGEREREAGREGGTRAKPGNQLVKYPSLKEHCLDLRTFWFKSMTCKHHAPYLNMLTTALYLMFAITLMCLCYKSLPLL